MGQRRNLHENTKYRELKDDFFKCYIAKLVSAGKAVLRGKFVVLNAFIRKDDRLSIQLRVRKITK